VQNPAPADSVIVQSAIEDSLTVTVPVGFKPEYLEETVTDMCSTSSSP
jgi:hypothetical protein